MNILVAEDEDALAEMYRLSLQSRNHKATITKDGNECLQVYKKSLSMLRGTRANEAQEATTPNNSGQKTEILSDNKTRSTMQNQNDEALDDSSVYSSPPAPFDVVVLDYRMPKINGLYVAKEILRAVPRQRIIFASAYVKETLESSIKELNQVVELLQKPFEPTVLIDTIEDREAYEGIKNLMINVKQITDLDKPTTNDIKDLFENLTRIQKGRIH